MRRREEAVKKSAGALAAANDKRATTERSRIKTDADKCAHGAAEEETREASWRVPLESDYPSPLYTLLCQGRTKTDIVAK